MSSVFIEEYSPKSFVVRGDTREHKESLKSLGGKWNSGLTDKKSGDKFGAWLFWNEKQQEIKSWIAKGCKSVEKSETEVFKPKEINTFEKESSKNLEVKVDILLKMMEALCKHQGIEISGNRVVKTQTLHTNIMEFDSDEDIEPVKPLKRLLGK
jgi:hypothetical protein